MPVPLLQQPPGKDLQSISCRECLAAASVGTQQRVSCSGHVRPQLELLLALRSQGLRLPGSPSCSTADGVFAFPVLPGPSESLHWNWCQRHAPERQKINRFFRGESQIIPVCTTLIHFGDKLRTDVTQGSSALVPGALR